MALPVEDGCCMEGHRGYGAATWQERDLEGAEPRKVRVMAEVEEGGGWLIKLGLVGDWADWPNKALL